MSSMNGDLLTIYSDIRKALEAGLPLASKELQDLSSQLLQYEFWANCAWCVIGLIGLLLAIIILVWSIFTENGGALGLVFIFFFISTPISIATGLNLLKIHYAPKLYLIEYISGALRGYH